MNEFDFIIVGGGTAGCVLANRLSADPSNRVLLIEAGHDRPTRAMQIPLFFSKVSADPKLGWNFMADAEPHAGGRALAIKRGKLIGGSSAINGLAYTRGHPADYDGWADAGAAGWRYEDVLPYFRRVETNWRGESTTHGGDGPMPVSRYPRDEKLFAKIAAATAALGFPANEDFDANGADGFGCYDTTTRRGRRASAATQYLDPVRHRSNLTIRTEALVTKILTEGRRAIGVEHERGGKLERVKARREVLVCGGTYNSPHLLMLSGIGPGEELSALGIPVVQDLPGVGLNLQEHPVIGAMFRCNDMFQFDRDMRFDRLALSLLRWRLFGTGLLSGVPLGGVGFFRSTPELQRPDVEVAFVTSSFEARPWFPLLRSARGQMIWCCTWLLAPKSRGRVRLRSPDPRDHPTILHNLLAEPSDVDSLRGALENIRAIAATAPLSGLIEGETLPGPDVRTEQEIENYLRTTAVPGAHPTSTCAMGDGAQAVTDAELRVRGMERLRVIDASVMPKVVAAHTNAATLMIAERGADLVLGQTIRAVEPA
jgi:Choline dehydrogenase and related flavoproteins